MYGPFVNQIFWYFEQIVIECNVLLEIPLQILFASVISKFFAFLEHKLIWLLYGKGIPFLIFLRFHTKSDF